MFTRVQRLLIGVVVSGAVIIAAIGFAGSYQAVRELAIKKGFGNFSYVFPIGIDAGICVLLALDLLLTWIRIPFPLLRPTAWLLTAATIAFNGAAAWPNPLGVGMHAVIPVLFVVAVEAARHTIDRIADITADKHMEGVRITRWLLAPTPTFLLWRRMKLWELRSYNQVIKLEQERLVYQAHLHSRYGRAWRRKAPVEALIPLKLAKYGLPLTDTAATGLAAAGVEPVPDPGAAPSVLDPTQRQRRGLLAAGAGSSHAAAQSRSDGLRPSTPAPDRLSSVSGWLARLSVAQPCSQSPSCPGTERQEPPARVARPSGRWSTGPQDPTEEGARRRLGAERARSTLPQVHYASLIQLVSLRRADEEVAEELAGAHLTHARKHRRQPDAALADSVYKQDGTTTADAPPATDQDQEALVVDFQQRATNTRIASPAAKDERRPHVKATIDGHSPPTSAEGGGLTLVDRYYLAWREYQTQHDDEPTGQKLSAYLADKGMHSRNGKPISPSTLRRYLLPFRLYTVWAKHRERSTTPALEAIAHDCAAHRITAQYNKPITTHDINEHVDDFERRWQSLAQHHAHVQQ
ncbi:DUF2637 domain-containing protein [Streptomyces sp. NPDC005708]|uniref:DUF2637 domain-containing protein n=1 Tax=Streptomyces sp. NPDC005708 TaxID=3154564 RepID=UPI0033DE10F5